MQIKKILQRIKEFLPFKIKLKKYKKHFVIRIAVYEDPFWPALALGIITGLFLIYFPFTREPQHNATTAYSTEALSKEISNDYIPREIFIPIFELALPIKGAAVLANDWDLFNDHVSWYMNSGNLLEGNIVLYAHNKKDLFGPITQLEKGRLVILSSNNLQQRYEVVDTFEASPADIHLIEDQDKDQLTMYTCSGWFDNQRFFVVAEPIVN